MVQSERPENTEFGLWRAPCGTGPSQGPPAEATTWLTFTGVGVLQLDNDPSAGSPTETLLRLLLPLNDRVWITFRPWVVVASLPGPVRKPH